MHSLYTYELVCPFVCELSWEGAAKGGFKGPRSVCAVSGGFKRQKVVVIPELAGKKCFFFYQRPFEGPHVFLLSAT